MIPEYLSAIGSATAPAMGNHLWQSTFCLLVAGMLTLALRKNHARVRYGLWLAASIKFLIPFSLLIVIGSHLAKPRVVALTERGFFYGMEQVGQPFTPPAVPAIPLVVHLTTLANLLPAIPVAMWFCGCVVVLFVWHARWRRISAALREAALLREGRELDALRRVEGLLGVRQAIDLLLSPANLEPGIFGIVKPVLVWPKGISERLDDPQLEAILAHEACHVRRRDNLAAVIHMVVEALFWFHPLIWWLGSRLLDERERTCDEEVLEAGSDRKVYAESILKTCEFCVESPLACVSGVTSADFKKRIVRIMSEGTANKLSFVIKLLLAAIAIAAVAGPLIFGVVNAPQIRAASQAQNTTAAAPVFEVASIKPVKSGGGFGFGGGKVMFSIGWSPNGFTARDQTLLALIQMAYGVQRSQISGGPNWLTSERFDIEAKVGKSLADKLWGESLDQLKIKLQPMLQALLADRCMLTIHRGTKELPVYALVIAKNGPKFREAKPGDTYPNGIKGPDGRPGGADVMQFRRGLLSGQGLPIGDLVQGLRGQPELGGRMVVDQTGLKGNYDFTLQWTPEQPVAAMAMGPEGGKPAIDNEPPPESFGPSIFTALQEQLGLKLESATGPVEVLVIDHIERPSEN